MTSIFERARQAKAKQPISASNASFRSESGVNNEVSGVCPKCGITMKTVIASTFTRGDLPAHYCESCCVATPVQE